MSSSQGRNSAKRGPRSAPPRPHVFTAQPVALRHSGPLGGPAAKSGQRFRQGMALASVLLMSVVLLVLALSFLYFLERDYRFAGHQEKNMQARFLALSGLRYYLHRPDLFPPGTPPTRRYVPASSTTQYFEVEVAADGTVRSRGVVNSALAVVVERTLVVEAGRPVLDHFDSSL